MAYMNRAAAGKATGERRDSMPIGTVLGEVRLEKCLPGWENTVCKQVRLEDGLLVAADPVGAKPGELVLVMRGAPANGYAMELRCDALIAGIVAETK